MGDTETPQTVPPVPNQQRGTPTVRIARETPVIYADALASHSYTADVSKIYFIRYDSDPKAEGSGTEDYVAQIIIPNAGLVNLLAFVEHRVKIMISMGLISQENVDKSRQFWQNSTEKMK